MSPVHPPPVEGIVRLTLYPSQAKQFRPLLADALTEQEFTAFYAPSTNPRI
jgi:hypothetical protein